MLKKSVLILAFALSTGCAAKQPAAVAPVTALTVAPAAPATTPRAVNPHIVVTMPDGWTPVDLSSVPRGSFATSRNEDVDGRMLITQGRVTGTAKEEAIVLAIEPRRPIE